MALRKKPKAGAKPKARTKPKASKPRGKSGAEAFEEDQARGPGRPSKYSREIVESILDDYIHGATLEVACANHDVLKGSFLMWVVDDRDGIYDLYERARRAKAWHMAEEIATIADTSHDDIVIDPKTKQPRTNHEVIQRSVLRVDARKWIVSRVLRDQFSEKSTLDLGGKVDLASAGAGLAEKLAKRNKPSGAD